MSDCQYQFTKQAYLVKIGNYVDYISLTIAKRSFQSIGSTYFSNILILQKYKK